jgi:hypothetical protein
MVRRREQRTREAERGAHDGSSPTLAGYDSERLTRQPPW